MGLINATYKVEVERNSSREEQREIKPQEREMEKDNKEDRVERSHLRPIEVFHHKSTRQD
jgi:hypothetical protein